MSIPSKVPGYFKIFTIAQALAPACEYPRVSASTVAPVDVAHTYGSRHTWRSAFHNIPSAFICVHLRLISVSLSDRNRKIKFELFPIINENGLTKSPQSTQGSQSSAIPVKYEKVAVARFRTRMTRIARIFTDMRAYVFDYFPSDQQTLSYLKLLENKPQINADERRFIVSASEYISLNLKTFNSRSNYS